MTAVTDIATTARDSIGRYFSLVSFLPAVLLVGYTFILFSSGAWQHSPSFSQAADSVTHLTLGSALFLVISALAVGVILHPLQFAATQFLEGYWGSGTIASRARGLRMTRHAQRRARLRRRTIDAAVSLEETGEELLEHDVVEFYTRLSERDEADRLASQLPPDGDQIMPTRLGNALRYYEEYAGRPYNLNVVQIMPYLSRVAPADDMAYVNDQRSQLDLAVRLCLTSLLASAMSASLLWRYGTWLLIALIPYMIAYLSYRGAVVAAHEYGRSLAVVIALNRFSLYQRLHLKLPANTESERQANETLNYLLSYNETESMPYIHPK